MWLKKIKSKKFVYILVFIIVFLASRLPGLGTDVINPDGVNWHFRSEQFIVGFKTLDLAKTNQHYHPGVTLMWIVGPVVEILKQISGESVYNNQNFFFFHFWAKFVLVLIHLALSLLGIFVLNRVLAADQKKYFNIPTFVQALIIFSIFSFEPFYLGNSRILHMDVLLTLILFIGLCFAYLYYKQNKFSDGLYAGVFFGLSILTKIIGMGGLLYTLTWFFVGGILLKRDFGYIKKLGLLLGVFCLTTFILFPALWVDFTGVVQTLVAETDRVGLRKGHDHLFFGVPTIDPGPLFYPLVILLKFSPFVLVGLLLYIFYSLKQFLLEKKVYLSNFLWFVGLFYLSYVFVMTFPSKKLDRYMVPLFPLFGIYAFYGYGYLSTKIRTLFVTLSCVLFIVVPLFQFYPYYFVYTNPIFGDAAAAHKIIAQKPFGVAIPELQQRIYLEFASEYENGEPSLGFIDIKPMSRIYPNSKVFDARKRKAHNYDVLVLGPNEEIPYMAETDQSGVIWEKKFSIYINGLEYWRVYEKG